MGDFNSFGQPVGAALSDWQPRAFPPRAAMVGRFCRLEPIQAHHADALFDAYAAAADERDWTYLPVEELTTREAMRAFAAAMQQRNDPQMFAIIDGKSGKAVGVAAYMRIEPAHGSIEIGHVNFSPTLQRRPAASEAIMLMMRRVFDELGYRRLEWKCHSLNERSRAAALRFGFTFEGVFRQAMVAKGRNRDTAWFSIIDSEWTALRAAHDAWLAPDNFDADGKQRVRLAELVEAARSAAAISG